MNFQSPYQIFVRIPSDDVQNYLEQRNAGEQVFPSVDNEIKRISSNFSIPCPGWKPDPLTCVDDYFDGLNDFNEQCLLNKIIEENSNSLEELKETTPNTLTNESIPKKGRRPNEIKFSLEDSIQTF